MYLKIPNDVTKAHRPMIRRKNGSPHLKKHYSFNYNLDLKYQVFKHILPSLITSGTHDIFGSFDVKGDATDASASDRDIPACAVLKAPQSLAPSPHMAT